MSCLLILDCLPFMSVHLNHFLVLSFQARSTLGPFALHIGPFQSFPLIVWNPWYSDSRGASINIADFHDLEERSADVRFIHFCCTMNGQAVYKRVFSVPDLSVFFCLNFPLREYDSASKTVVLVTNPLALQ